jgi:heme-degrading monooxygenase HmoA
MSKSDRTPPLPQPPYYAVIFTSVRREVEEIAPAHAPTVPADPLPDYEATARRMVELAHEQPGFLGVESARGPDGLGITVSYWENEDSIRRWREDAEHRLAQKLGRERWYAWFALRVAKVERAWEFSDC